MLHKHQLMRPGDVVCTRPVCWLQHVVLRPQVDKCHADRQALAARQRAKGWSEERVLTAVHDLKEQQRRREDSFSWAGEHFFELGGLDYNVVRFFKTLIKVRTRMPIHT